MKVINFYGGAGIGKSTIAADIFSKLKRYGVEYAVCDSPLPLNIIYNNKPEEIFDALVLHEHRKFDNLEYLLRRNDEYPTLLHTVYSQKVTLKGMRAPVPRVSGVSS